MKRIIEKSTRQEMESNVIAYNCFLKESVDNMSVITLLRNMHPADRPEFARTLYQEGILIKGEAIEFLNLD